MKLSRYQFTQLLRQLPTWQLATGSAVVLLAIWGLDYVVRVDLGFSIFYVLPIAAIAWYVSPTAGYLISLVSALLWLVAESARSPSAALSIFLGWNTAVRLAFWLLVVSLLAELKASYDKEQHLARMDFLTGLLNRRAFSQALEQEIARSKRYQLTFTLAYLDVDNFKQVNDRFGHAAGDLVLRAIAQTLQHSLRTTDHASRLGGDEFAICMPQTDQLQAKTVLERLFQQLTQIASPDVPIGFSMGAVTFLAAPESADYALSITDKVMYGVKARGKNQLSQEIHGQSPH